MKYLIIILSLLSGIIMSNTVPHLGILLFGAGIIYGILTFLPLYKLAKSKKIFTCFVWIIGSSLSYIIAVWVTIKTTPSSGPSLLPETPPLSYVFAGAVGALILAVTYKILAYFHKWTFSLNRIFIMITVGAIIPGLIVAVFKEYTSWKILFIIWPTVMTTIMFYDKDSSVLNENQLVL